MSSDLSSLFIKGLPTASINPISYNLSSFSSYWFLSLLIDSKFLLFQLTLLLLSLDSAILKSFSLLLQLFFLLSFSHLFSLYYCLLTDGIFRCPLNLVHIITILDSLLDFLIRLSNLGSILNSVFLLNIYSLSWSSIICFTYFLNSFPISVATL